MNIALTAFTRKGWGLARELFQRLSEEGHLCALFCPRVLAGPLGISDSYESLGAWAGERFSDSNALIFVGASGIAVRAIAPYVRDKFTDPAVVSVDEAGQFVIPLLSGHVGGANDLARLVAELTGGMAAVSTATDVNGVFAVDQWAREQGLFLDGRAAAKHISAALLAGKTIGIKSDFPVEGELPALVEEGEGGELGFHLTLDGGSAPFQETLRLIPTVLNVGVGCRRGTPAEDIAEAVDGVFSARRLSPRGIKRICSIDLKKDEFGLLSFCRSRGVPLVTYTAEELLTLSGTFTPSPFVQRVTGVDNVCERAAVRAGGELIIQKQAENGVTVAVSQEPFVVRFS